MSDLQNTSMTCSKCTATMEKGFIADYAYGASDSSLHQNLWIEGELEKNWFGVAKVKDRKKFYIITYRCIRCGFLESFATEEKL